MEDLHGAPRLPEGFEDLGLIGRGGMGEVRRVREAALDRVVAMKVMTGSPSPAQVEAFMAEARATARLDHPGVVPVHQVGLLPDGRPYFTMREIVGRTLADIIAEVHRGPGREANGSRALRRLLEALRAACEAVAFAHSRGVLHRDLKPANVLMGAFGEVQVVDWGLSRGAGEGGDPAHPRIGGTPAYMSPEQAMGEAALSAASDVYGLGAILYEILSGRPPYLGPDPVAVLMQVRTGPPLPPSAHRACSGEGDETLAQLTLEIDSLGSTVTFDDAPPAWAVDVQAPQPPRVAVPTELEAICLKALARDPAQRYDGAAALGEAIEGWLDGAWKEEQAEAVAAEADALLPEIDALRQRAAQLREEAAAALAELKSWEPTASRLGPWAREDEAADLERRRDVLTARYLQGVQGALIHAPDHPELHRRLARFHAGRHQAAEAAGDELAALFAEVMLRAHDRGEFALYLRGEGALTLVTDPPGAEALLFRYEEVGRREILEPVRPLGTSPVVDVALPLGSYSVQLRAPGREDVVYPFLIERLQRWDGAPPGGAGPLPIPLPPVGVLGPEERYIPPGYAWIGGDPDAWRPLPAQRVWVDGFTLCRFPVTNAEFLIFLDDLVAQGREGEAHRYQPRERGSQQWEEGAPLYGRRPSGSFYLKPDADGDEWLPEHPVVMVTWAAATAYARWRAARDGVPWRLPSEVEWEKASRGADGRRFPFGDHLDCTWALVEGTRPGRADLAEVDTFPLDESPYGVRGLAGNVRDWTRDDGDRGPVVRGGRLIIDPRDGDPDAGGRRVIRGGSYDGSPAAARCASRMVGGDATRGFAVGFRVARSWP